MKKIALLLLVFMLAIPACFAEGLTVTGTGVVEAAPDCAVVDLGVSVSEKTVLKAQKSVNKKIAAIRKAVLDQGVDAEDISLSSVSFYPDYDYNEDRIRGYNAAHALTIRVKNIDDVGKIIDAAINAGANNLNNVAFDVADQADAVNQALVLALDNAKAKAQAIAQAAGVKLGKIESITVNDEYYNIPINAFRGKTSMETDEGTVLDAGVTNITASITVEYKIED